MLNALVSVIDKRLRVRDGIFEYSDCARCIFRAQFSVNTNNIALSDGTHLAAGSHLIVLHLWNERIPPLPAGGPTLGWARRLCHGFEISLEKLAAFVAGSSALDDITAIAGNAVFAPTQHTQAVANLAMRYGFVHATNPASRESIAQRLHRMGENVLIAMLVIAYNPAAFRADTLRRDRVPLYLHRTELMSRYGSRNGALRASSRQ
jgi:hypothetical protein